MPIAEQHRAKEFGRFRHSAFGIRHFWISLALIAATLVVYAPVWRHDFVNFDDLQYVRENPDVSGGLTARSVSWAFSTGHAGNWHPVTWLSHMLDVQLFGLNAGAHHLANALFHIANSLLLFALLHRMTAAPGRSAFVAGLFAVHPLHVESVAWIAERKDVLSTLFWMFTLWGYLAYVRRPRLGRYLVVLLLFALGLMAKPMLVTLPFVLLLLDFWPLGRATRGTRGPRGGLHRGTRGIRGGLDRGIRGIRGSGVAPASGLRPPAPEMGRVEQRSALELIWEKLPLFALAIASSIVTFVVQQHGGAVKEFDALPLDRRVANALVAYVGYIGKMLWPSQLAAVYPYSRSLPEWYVAGATVGLIAVSVAVIRAARRHPYLPVGWLWYLGTLVPVIGLIQVGSQPMADRYTYVPLIGLFIIVAWGVPDLLGGPKSPARHAPPHGVALPAAAVLVMAACTATARAQVQHWRNSVTLWEHALEVTAENYRAHNNLGHALAKQGRVGDAVTHYSEALRIKPDYAEARNNLGLALADDGRIGEAIPHYAEALRLVPDYWEAHNNLGVALARQGKSAEAIRHFSEALRLKPDLTEAHRNLGFAHNDLGAALADQGRMDEAITHYSEALRINPDSAEAHSNLGRALASQGKTDESIHELMEAVRVKPDDADFQYDVAVMFAREGRIAEAIHHFEAALKINPRHEAARRALDVLTSRGKG